MSFAKIAASREHRLAMARLADKYVGASEGGVKAGPGVTRRQINAALDRDRESLSERLIQASDAAEAIRVGLRAKATAEERQQAQEALVRLQLLANRRSRE